MRADEQKYNTPLRPGLCVLCRKPVKPPCNLCGDCAAWQTILNEIQVPKAQR